VSAVEEDGAYTITGALLPGEPGADQPQAGPGTDILLDGDDFSCTRSAPLPQGGALEITYSGVVDGDTFAGTVNIGGFAEAPYTGVRQ
jgi:hypothetical protein